MKTRTFNRIKQETDTYRDELIDLCRTLVNFETPSDSPDSFKPAFQFLSKEFKTLGFEPRHVSTPDTGGHLYLRPDQRERNTPLQLILGHVDTVWDHGTIDETPFELENNNRATGPGLFDMKAGLAQLIIAFQIIDDLDLSLEVEPVIFINSDEEIGSPTSTRHIRRLSKIVDRCYVLEPALGPEGAIKTARKGVGHFTITIEGKASHAGISPRKGSSAILELSHIIQSLNELDDPDEGITVNVGVIEGGTRSNVVAESSKAEVDVRVITEQQAREIEGEIRALEPDVQGVDLSIEGGFRRPPMEFNESNQKLWAQIKNRAEELDLELDHGMSGGGSDGNTASQYTPTVDGLGPVGDGAHESYEYIELNDVLDRTALLVSILAMELETDFNQGRKSN